MVVLHDFFGKISEGLIYKKRNFLFKSKLRIHKVAP